MVRMCLSLRTLYCTLCERGGTHNTVRSVCSCKSLATFCNDAMYPWPHGMHHAPIISQRPRACVFSRDDGFSVCSPAAAACCSCL